MVSDSNKKKGPQQKAVPTAKNGGKVVAATASSSKATASVVKKVDGVAKKVVQKSADDLAKKAAQKKADAMAKRAAQKKADAMAKRAAQKKADAAAKRVGKAVVAAATVDDVARKAAAATAKRVGKAVAAAATVFDVANGVYTLQISDQTHTGVHCSHPLSRDILPVKENMREKEENNERPGLVQCKYCLSWGDCTFGKACKCNHGRRKIPVAPIMDYNFLGLPIRPGKKDCPHYMRHGSCMYESNCRFNHPDPTTMEGGDAPSLCGDGGSGPSQGAFQPTMFSWSPPRTANETVPFVPVVFSPTQKVPPPNVEWNLDQDTSIMETPQPHSSLSPVDAAPSPTTTTSSPPASPTSTDSRLPVSPTTADCTPTSPKLVEEDDPEFAKAARYRKLCPKMVKLCARSCELKAAYEFVDSTIDYMCAEVDKMFLKMGDSIDGGIEQLDVVDPKFLQVNGLKTRFNLRRCKPTLRQRKKVISKPTLPGQAMGAESLLQSI